MLTVLIGVISSLGTVLANHEKLNICCAWNGALADGILTYSISGGGALEQETVRLAVEEWNTALMALGGPPLTLAKVDDGGDFEIRFQPGRGTVAGQAQRQFDQSGLIRHVRLRISGKAFGQVSEQATVAEITRHEVGRGLGAGHANFPDLMDPTVGGPSEISACDITGIEVANEWYFDGGSPAPPTVSEISCGTDAPDVDVLISDITASPSSVEEGEIVSIAVIVSNHGNTVKTVTVTVAESPDGDTGDTTVTLGVGETRQLGFTWDTTGASPVTHTLTASHELSGDLDVSNNRATTDVEVVASGGGGFCPPGQNKKGIC